MNEAWTAMHECDIVEEQQEGAKGIAREASEGTGVWKAKGCLLGGSQTYGGGSFSPALTARSILELACLHT